MSLNKHSNPALPLSLVMEPQPTAFESKYAAKLFVSAKSVREKKPFSFERSDHQRIEVVCPVQGCMYKMHFRLRKDGMFHITKARCEHTCDSFVPTLTRSWIISEIVKLLSESPTITVPMISDCFRRSFGLEVPVTKLERCTRQARNQLLAEYASFGKVKSFLDSFEIANPGSKTCFMTNEGEFQRAFLCPAMCVHAFQNATHVISLDVCHIKARYGGVVLVLTVLDGNGNIFPAAIGIAESENEDTWSWFLFTMRVALHVDDGGEGLVVLSDREKGIDAALKKAFPRSNHSCVFHIQKNIKTTFKTALNGLLFKAAKAQTKGAFDEAVAETMQLNPAAGDYVKRIRPEKWARSLFPARRFGHVTSNMAESTNQWLDEARFLDPVGLFCAYVRKLNQLFEKRRMMYEKMNDGDLPPNVAKTVKDSMDEGGRLKIWPHNTTMAEVQRKTNPNTKRVDNLLGPTCSCGFFAEFGIPCRHMCKAATRNGTHTKSLVIKQLHVAALKATYIGTTFPIDVNDLHDDGTAAPTKTKRRGRPKQKRIPSSAETVPKRTVRCGKCRGYGHNSMSCKMTSVSNN